MNVKKSPALYASIANRPSDKELCRLFARAHAVVIEYGVSLLPAGEQDAAWNRVSSYFSQNNSQL